MVTPGRDRSPSELFQQIVDGNDGTWAELVRQLDPLIWVIARANGAREDEAADVARATWLLLRRNATDVPATDITRWLATTTSLVARDPSSYPRASGAREGANVIEHEATGDFFDRDQYVRLLAAIDSLPDVGRIVVRAMLSRPAPTLHGLSEMLGVTPQQVYLWRRRSIDDLVREFDNPWGRETAISAAHLAATVTEDRRIHLYDPGDLAGLTMVEPSRPGRARTPEEVAGLAVDVFFEKVFSQVGSFEGMTVDDVIEAAHAAADNLLRAVAWSKVVGDRLSTSEVTELLGISRQAVAKRVGLGSLLGLPGSSTTWFPTWQFDIDAKQIRPETRLIIAAFRERLDAPDPLTIAAWAQAPQDELDNITPADWLTAGRDPDDVVRVAEHAAARLAA